MDKDARLHEENMSLEKNEEMDNFVDWMYENIQPHIGDTVIEAGAGIGTYSGKAASDGKEVYAVEYSNDYVELLKNKFADKEKLHIIHDSITNNSFVEDLKPHGIDSVFSLNVLEHVEDDQEALDNFYKVLKPGGTAVVLVPAHPFLFNTLDTAVGHIRRYSKKEFKGKISKAGFNIDELYYFNFPAIVGWFLNGNMLKRDKIEPSATAAFNKIVPIARWIEKVILRRKIGISLIAVINKPKQ